MFSKQCVVVCQKVVSLFEPHTAIIRRGKAPPHEIEFSRKVWYGEVDGGLISEYRIQKGNPPEAGPWLDSLKNPRRMFQHPPGRLNRGVLLSQMTEKYKWIHLVRCFEYVVSNT